jgi:hypothetical protein
MAKATTVEVRLDTSKVAADVDELSEELIDQLARRVLERIEINTALARSVLKQIDKIRREEGRQIR